MFKALKFVDSLLDRITMYRLLLYFLRVLIAAAIVLSQLGYLHYSPAAILFSAAYLVAICWVSNRVFAYVLNAPTNSESSNITALILALIITPISSTAGLLFMTAAGGLAIASKYMLTIRKKHIFNPAAIAVLLTSLGAGQSAGWWVGSAPMLPFVLVGGVLITRKVRRVQMTLSFILTSYVATVFYSLLTHRDVVLALQNITLNSALFFLAFVMLTEPLTSPTTARKQRWYAVLAGALFPPQFHLGTLYSTPELTLVISNVFAYIVSSKVKLFPTLSTRQALAPGITGFSFTPDRQLAYQPGQYMEWTLPHTKPDSRGDRRYLTLASSPTEPELRIGIRHYAKGSTYKNAMLSMDSTTPIVAAQLSGEFVMPSNRSRKLAFIAGGIGITPFRSMLKYLVDVGDARSVSMLYAAKTAEDIVYTDVFEAARKQLDAHIVYCISGSGAALPNKYYKSATLNIDLIRQEIPDYAERLFYISGSHGMVSDVKHALTELGVSSSNIKIDFFPGYA